MNLKAFSSFICYFYLLLSLSSSNTWSQSTSQTILIAPIRALEHTKRYLDATFNQDSSIISCQASSDEVQTPACMQAKVFYASHYKDDMSPEMVALFNQCLQARFELCYPALKPSIGLDELKKIFQAATQDKTFRMVSPEIYCYERANILSQYLAEQGYAAQIMHIDKAPVLIAIDKNQSGQNKGTYNDYEGTHYPLTMQVEVKAGVIETMVIDPQFFNEPVPLEKYLIATTGQKCEHTNTVWKTSNESQDFWYCNYRFLSQNFYPLASNAEIKDFPFEQASNKNNQCGWWNLDKHQAAINNINQKFDFSTSIKIPEEFKNLPPTELNRSLIKHAYQEKYQRMKTQYDEYADRLKKLEQDPQTYFNSRVFKTDLSKLSPEQAKAMIESDRAWLIKEMQSYEQIMKRSTSIMEEVERNLKTLD